MRKTRYCYKIFFIFSLIVILSIFIILFAKLYFLQQKVDGVQQTANILTQTLSVSNNVQLTENTQSLAFLQNETAKFREFIENQQDYLITLLTLLGTGLVGLFAFLGIQTKSDVEKTIQEHYISQIKKEIEDTIGGKEKKEYLVKCIDKEDLAHNKKILFLFQQEENENLLTVRGILDAHHYNLCSQKVGDTIQDDQIDKWVKEYDIIIYQVAETEFDRPGSHTDPVNPTYARLSTKCNGNGVYSILYCEDHTALNRSLYSSDFYTNNANYGLTVLERIFNLLYFI